MLTSDSPSFRTWLAALACAAVTAAVSLPVEAQVASIDPVTDAELRDPGPDEWLMWRRTLNGWGYSPPDQIDRDNVAGLRMVWSRGLGPGRQQGTPPSFANGVMYMPNPRDLIQAIDAVTGDLLWQYQRDRPDDLADYMIPGLIDHTRNIAIYDTLLFDSTSDDYVIALDATTGEVVWETEVLDYRVNPSTPTTPPQWLGATTTSQARTVTRQRLSTPLATSLLTVI